VKTIISKYYDILVKNSIKYGLTRTPAFILNPKEITILRKKSALIARFSLQCTSVSSKSKISVFLTIYYLW